MSAALNVQRRLVQALRQPELYPHPVKALTVIETHISFVILTGSFAYKIKKAVDLGFVDYTGLEQRRFFCAEELRLNRRLAPDLYLEAIAIAGTPEAPRFEAGGEGFEYAVKMREFDQEDLLDRVLARGGLSSGHIDGLAATLARFHAGAPPAAPGSRYGEAAAIRARAEENFSQIRALAAFDPRLLASLETWSREEFLRLQGVFAERRADGAVRECHGDLHLGNMALRGDEALVFDCIEFNRDLRWIDVASDIAFLVMDLFQRGRPDYGWRLLNDWLEMRGDYRALAPLRFYAVYRALVRAKVAAIRSADETLPLAARQVAGAACSAYLEHADGLARSARPALIVTHGYSGSGKSWAARALAESLGAVRLTSDVERKRLHGLAPRARSASGLASGLYAESATAATYERLADLAAMALAAGYRVIVDAACLRRWQRDRLRLLASGHGIPFVILDCRAPAALLRQRLESRAATGADPSEANPAVLESQMRSAEALTRDETAVAIAVDTAQGWQEAEAAIRQALRIA